MEAREDSSRQNLTRPEDEGDGAPIELCCCIGGQCFAFEHTGIEPFEGQIDFEAKARLRPLRRMFIGQEPQYEQYELEIPKDAIGNLKKVKGVISALA